MSLSGPASATDGSVFTETVTVTNLGPSVATRVATNLLIPAGLTVTAAPGASLQSGTLVWVDPSLPSPTSVVYHVTVQVGATSQGTAAIGVVTGDDGNDPNPHNNAAITTIQLVP